MREPLFIASSQAPPPVSDMPAVRPEELDGMDLAATAFLLLDGSDWQLGYRQLQQIRAFSSPNIYLKPVIFHGSPEAFPREAAEAADGLVNQTEGMLERAFASWAAQCETINARLDRLPEVSADGDSSVAFKVLRFIMSRNSEFKPVPSVRQIGGYTHPMLQPFFTKRDVGVIQTLEYLESQRLLQGRFISRSYACTHCGCAFLNFYETCPDCGSSDIRTEELLHHFRCAYVGELSDYRRGNDLLCPKCNKELKHIGVDYDKASIVHRCNECSAVFQEPRVMTSCYDCWRDTDPENQVVRDIKAYSITSLGENAARYGMDSLLQTILESRAGSISYEVFKEFFRVELARIERYNLSTSCLAILRLDNIDMVYGRLGKRAQEIFTELSEAVKAGLRTSDVFCVRDETIFLVILTETPRENGELAIARLEQRIIELVEANMNMTFKVDSRIVALAPGLDLEQCIESFLQDHAV